MTSPIALIDVDPIKYAASFACEHRDKENDTITLEKFAHVTYNINTMIKRCIKRCEAREYRCFITPLHDKDNFRFKIFPEYKANRIGIRKPYYLEQAQEYLLNRWHAESALKGNEADDSIAIAHTSYHPFGFNTDVLSGESPYTGNGNSIICSIDKDFNNVPGWHYNPGKDEFTFITEIEALRNFYLQILTGDVSDNIPRVKKGWRQKKVEEQLQKALTEQEMYDIIYQEVYDVLEREDISKDYKVTEFIQRNGQLVWLRTKENEMWKPKV